MRPTLCAIVLALTLTSCGGSDAPKENGHRSVATDASPSATADLPNPADILRKIDGCQPSATQTDVKGSPYADCTIANGSVDVIVYVTGTDPVGTDYDLAPDAGKQTIVAPTFFVQVSGMPEAIAKVDLQAIATQVGGNLLTS